MQQGTSDGWSSRPGLILAMAGSAVGLGNFLRFPVQAAQNGGGAFVIPYLVSMLFLGVPLMGIEWAMGRYGGRVKRNSLPGIFAFLWPNQFSKYLGGIGILLSFTVAVYYTYIGSWSLAYSFYAITGKFNEIKEYAGMESFLRGFQGLESNQFFSSGLSAYIFMLITLSINIWVLSHGISKGIERFAKITMPLLFLMGILLIVRVFTLGGTINSGNPGLNLNNAFGFLWNPDFRALGDLSVWLSAAGQVFFTLSLGFGQILTYATYLRHDDDIALSGLTAVSLNGICEVIVGSSIGIIGAYLFFGQSMTVEIAKGGAFDLGFVSMPLIFTTIPMGNVFASVWFFLLFFAGITSSLALIQPSVCFISDVFDVDSRRASAIVGIFLLVCIQPIYFLLGKGYLDELDFLAGTLGLVFFALVEVVTFIWVFGRDKSWYEITRDNDIRILPFFRPIVQWVTPAFLLMLFGAWFIQKAPEILFFGGIPQGEHLYRWFARAFMLAIFAFICLLIKLKEYNANLR